MPNDLSAKLRDAFHWVPPGNERGELALAAADLIDQQAAEIERLKEEVDALRWRNPCAGESWGNPWAEKSHD